MQSFFLLCPNFIPELCRGDPDVNLLIQCYDYNRVLPSSLIGSAQVTLPSSSSSFSACACLALFYFLFFIFLYLFLIMLALFLIENKKEFLHQLLTNN